MAEDGLPSSEAPGIADKTIALKNSHNVTLRDFSILAGGHFGIIATGVDNLTIDNLKIDTNRGDVNIDACRNVRVTNCSVNSPWDDGIGLKSSLALGRPRPTEDVTISDCYVTGGYQLGAMFDGSFRRLTGPQLSTGRIKRGTESNGGFRNITISNCVFESCRGLRWSRSIVGRWRRSRSSESPCAISAMRRSSYASARDCAAHLARRSARFDE